MTLKSENQLMHGISVALLTEDREQAVTLQGRVDSTHMARTVFSHVGLPSVPGDSILRHLQDQRAEVVLVEIDSQQPQRAIRTIELIHTATPDVTIFALGDMSQPLHIVNAMGAGGR